MSYCSFLTWCAKFDPIDFPLVHTVRHNLLQEKLEDTKGGYNLKW